MLSGLPVLCWSLEVKEVSRWAFFFFFFFKRSSQPQDERERQRERERERTGGVWLPLVESRWNDMRWRQRCSEVVPRLVLRLRGSEVVLQKGLQVLEGGPLLRVLLPALHHQLVQRRGAVLRARHPVASLHLLQHLAVVHAWRDGSWRQKCGWKISLQTV